GEDQPVPLDQAEDGALLIGTTKGFLRVDGRKIQAYPLPIKDQPSIRTLLRDREGSLWIATRNRGLVHVHEGKADVFAESDGLSSDQVLGLYEDREGSIWVRTYQGLDQFREFAAATIPANRELPGAAFGSVLGDRDGGVWLGASEGLWRWNQGLTIYRKPGS